MNEKMVIEESKRLGFTVTKQQMVFAREKNKKIKLHKKNIRIQKQKKKELEKQQEQWSHYEERAINDFLETGEINTVDDYFIIKENFF